MTTRRRLLATTTLAVSVAGCTGMPNDAELTATEANAPSDADRIVFTDLPPDERQLVERALNGELVHACPGEQDRETLGSFGDRLDPDTYLRRDETDYGLWVRIADTLRADTAPPPATDRSCGLL